VLFESEPAVIFFRAFTVQAFYTGAFPPSFFFLLLCCFFLSGRRSSWFRCFSYVSSRKAPCLWGRSGEFFLFWSWRSLFFGVRLPNVFPSFPRRIRKPEEAGRQNKTTPQICTPQIFLFSFCFSQGSPRDRPTFSPPPVVFR